MSELEIINSKPINFFANEKTMWDYIILPLAKKIYGETMPIENFDQMLIKWHEAREKLISGKTVIDMRHRYLRHRGNTSFDNIVGSSSYWNNIVKEYYRAWNNQTETREVKFHIIKQCLSLNEYASSSIELKQTYGVVSPMNFLKGMTLDWINLWKGRVPTRVTYWDFISNQANKTGKVFGPMGDYQMYWLDIDAANINNQNAQETYQYSEIRPLESYPMEGFAADAKTGHNITKIAFAAGLGALAYSSFKNTK